MGASSNGGGAHKTEKSVLKKSPVLGLKNFSDPQEIKKLALECGVTPTTIVREINHFRDFLQKNGLLVYTDRDHKQVTLDEWGCRFIRAARKARKENTYSQEGLLAGALTCLMNEIWSTHEHIDCRVRAEEKLSIAQTNLEAAEDRVCRLQDKFEIGIRHAGILKNRIEQLEIQIDALKNLISAMTYSQTKEREALIKQFIGSQLGEVVDRSVFSSNS